ncbi:MAG: sugar phosphate isomerase/epimerase [Chloroflexota bacterium]
MLSEPAVGLQLYTLRDAMEKDLVGTIHKVAEIGYSGVETAFFAEGVTLAEAASIINDAGLVVPSAHTEIPLGKHERSVLELAEAFDTQRIIWHGWPQDPNYSTVDGMKRLANIYNQANAIAQANGLQFGIHNHWWEFELQNGRFPYQVLLEEMDESIFFEIDLYWAAVAGHDPTQIVIELAGRAPLLHIKDGPAKPGMPMTAVGSGSLDLAEAIGAAEGLAEWLIVELDECATDMMTAVAESYEYLTGNGLAEGNV